MSRTVVKSRFPQISRELGRKVDVEVRDTAYAIGRRARQLVPERTSALHDAIHVEPNEHGGGHWVVAHSDEAWYGHLVEFGTSAHQIKNAFGREGLTVEHPGGSPRPFLTPAAESEREPFERRVQRILDGL